MSDYGMFKGLCGLKFWFMACSKDVWIKNLVYGLFGLKNMVYGMFK